MSDRELELARDATAPARWLLEAASSGGVALTQTSALARAVVREAAERWPAWWNAELFGPPHREADVAVLGALHEGLRRLRLVRRRGRKLHATARGRELAADPVALLRALASDLGGDEAFVEMVADEVLETLSRSASCEHDQLVAPALRTARRDGWRDAAGNGPDERDVSWIVSGIVCRGEAYGLIARMRDPASSSRLASRISLTAAGRIAFGKGLEVPAESNALVFDAELVNVPGVGALISVASHGRLCDLHDTIQDAFGWADDHLYSFWLDGRFWGDEETEYVRPDMPERERASAAVPLAELGLEVGSRIAYVFDYGDEWRVRLTLRERRDGVVGPHVLERRGAAPTQYPPLNDEPA